MGRIPEKGKEKTEDRLASLNSEPLDEEHIDEVGDREETPDLYRNSALGMWVSCHSMIYVIAPYS